MQDQRDKNRIREHAGHGWEEVRREEFVPCLNGPGILMKCPCDWVGWIHTEQ
jgi:hypothetical protein